MTLAIASAVWASRYRVAAPPGLAAGDDLGESQMTRQRCPSRRAIDQLIPEQDRECASAVEDRSPRGWIDAPWAALLPRNPMQAAQRPRKLFDALAHLETPRLSENHVDQQH